MNTAYFLVAKEPNYGHGPDKWKLFQYEGKPHGDGIRLTTRSGLELNCRTQSSLNVLSLTPESAHDKAMVLQKATIAALEARLAEEHANLISLGHFHP